MTDDTSNHSWNLNGTPWFLHDCTLEPDNQSRRVALFLLYMLIFVAGLLENSVVLWVNWRRRHSANGVLFCIINVTLSDLMVITILPFFIMETTLDKVWLWGRFLCKVTYLVYLINFYSSSIFLALMTLERYRSLSQPSARSLFPVVGKQRWVLCGGVWILSFILALLENVHVDLLEWEEPGCYMVPEYNYFEWFAAVTFISMFFQFLGPGAIIVTCNVLIARAVRTTADVQDRRDVWLVHVYSLVFTVCWLPYHMTLLLMIVDDFNPFLFSCNMVEGLYFSFSVVQTLTLFHCVANPILYNFLSKSFRNNLVNTVLDHIPRQEAPAAPEAGTQPGAPNGGGAKATSPRKWSSGSTSQSDVDS